MSDWKLGEEQNLRSWVALNRGAMFLLHLRIKSLTIVRIYLVSVEHVLITGIVNVSFSSFALQEGDTVFFMRSVTPAADLPDCTERILANVFFKDFDGKTLTLHDIPIGWTVRELRKKLEREKSLDTSEYGFLWGGKQLEDGNTLELYGISKDPTIHMVMRLLGGDCSL